MYKLVSIDQSNLELIEHFLYGAGKSLASFRYFKKRPIHAVLGHIVTYLMFNGAIPVCYGHLDQENNTVWLGIAVAESYWGQGLGSMMMSYLISKARDSRIREIHLAVDNDNRIAISLYTKFGFVLKEKNDTFSIYVLPLE